MKRKPTKSQYMEIAKLIANSDCVLFLGSGVSMGEKDENGLPGAEELATDLFKEIKDSKPPLIGWERRNLAKVSNLFEIIKGKPALDCYIKGKISKVLEPLKFHKLVSQLPFKIIITTNYDLLLENQFDDIHKEYIKIVDAEDIKNWNEQKIIILKIHGCIDRSKELIISEDDYIKYLSKTSLFHDILKYLFCTKNVLFIGYSLSDINIKLILQTVEDVLGKRVKQHYLIQHGNIHEKIFSKLNEKGIEIFTINGVEFLQKLILAFEKDLKIGDKIGNKFDFYLNNYRLEILKFIKNNILRKFIEEIKNDAVSADDYRFWNQLVEVFSKKEDQKELSELIKKEQGVEIVLKVISQINIDSISEEIITQLNDLLVRTRNESIRISVLGYLHKNNKLKDETLPTLKQWKYTYPEDSEMGRFLSTFVLEKNVSL